MVILTDFPPPTEGIHHTEQNTIAFMKEKNLGKGSLYIAESRLSWVANSGQGFSLEYPSIIMHAVSKDLSSFPQECIYLMVDKCVDDENDGKDQEEDDDEDKEDGNVSELRFVPDNKDMLDVMFKAMSDCQALNPDPEDEISDEDYIGAEEEGDGIVYAADFNRHGSGDGNGYANEDENPEGENGNEPMDVGQFEDAEHDH